MWEDVAVANELRVLEDEDILDGLAGQWWCTGSLPAGSPTRQSRHPGARSPAAAGGWLSTPCRPLRAWPCSPTAPRKVWILPSAQTLTCWGGKEVVGSRRMRASMSSMPKQTGGREGEECFKRYCNSFLGSGREPWPRKWAGESPHAGSVGIAALSVCFLATQVV